MRFSFVILLICCHLVFGVPPPDSRAVCLKSYIDKSEAMSSECAAIVEEIRAEIHQKRQQSLEESSEENLDEKCAFEALWKEGAYKDLYIQKNYYSQSLADMPKAQRKQKLKEVKSEIKRMERKAKNDCIAMG